MIGLSHGDETAIRDVVSLHCGAFEMPVPVALPVGEVADEPVTGDRGGDAHSDTPNDPGPAT